MSTYRALPAKLPEYSRAGVASCPLAQGEHDSTRDAIQGNLETQGLECGYVGILLLRKVEPLDITQLCLRISDTAG